MSKTSIVPETEFEARRSLAALYRILDRYGMSDLANQEVGARIGDQPDHYLIHRYGLFYDEITASSLVKVDHQGTPVNSDGSALEESGLTQGELNDGGLNLAKWIFGSRPDINYFVHGHCEDIMAVSATQQGVLPLSQPSVYLGRLIGYLDYAFLEDERFGQTFMALCRRHDILISHNHGYYCFGRSAKEAFFRAYYLRQSCVVQVKALSMVGNDHASLRFISDQRSDGYRAAMAESRDYHYDGETEWGGLLRWLERHAPEYKD